MEQAKENVLTNSNKELKEKINNDFDEWLGDYILAHDFPPGAASAYYAAALPLHQEIAELREELVRMRADLLDKYARLQELSRNNYESIVAEEYPLAEKFKLDDKEVKK